MVELSDYIEYRGAKKVMKNKDVYIVLKSASMMLQVLIMVPSLAQSPLPIGEYNLNLEVLRWITC
jgi:hypothetical protein